MKLQTLKLPLLAFFSLSASQAQRDRRAGFVKQTSASLLFSLLALEALVLPVGAQTHAPPTNYNAMVPVYQIIQAGATGTQATNLAIAQNLPPSLLTLSKGLVSYINAGSFLSFPTNGQKWTP